MKKSLLGAIALGVGGSAVAGFGAAAGRDIWRGTKKASGFLILLIAIAASVSLPFLGIRNLMRGHAPGEGWKAIGDILMVPAGIAIGVGVSVFGGLMLGEEPFALAIITIVGSGLVAAVVGAIVGLAQRPSTQRRYGIAVARRAPPSRRCRTSSSHLTQSASWCPRRWLVRMPSSPYHLRTWPWSGRLFATAVGEPHQLFVSDEGQDTKLRRRPLLWPK